MATLTPVLRLTLPPFDETPWDTEMNNNLLIIDGAVGKFFSQANFIGIWKNATAFIAGQVVFDGTDSTEWLCNVSHTSAATGTFAADRTAHPTFWVQVGNSAQQSAQQAAASATAAASSASAANTALTTFQNIYYGSATSDPTVDPHGGARTSGDLYFNTTTQRLRVFSGAPGNTWVEITTGFNDAPNTPAGTTFGRTDTHAWAAVLDLNRTTTQTIVGDVIINPGQLGVGITPPAAAQPATAFASHWNALNVFGMNLFFDANPAPNGQWRYIVSSNPIPAAGGFGAALMVGTTSQSGVRFTTFYSTPTGELINANGAATLQTAMQYQSGAASGVGIQFNLFGSAFKPGGGVFADSSDSRIKNITGVYPYGLAEMLEMLPKMFTYKGNDQQVGPDGNPGEVMHPDTTTQHVGLIAQDCEPYMPDLVTQTSAFVDGVLVNDLRQINATGVIYALVNAVSQLNDLITALTNKVTALESA